MYSSICCDKKCKNSQKLIKSVLDDFDHQKHQVINVDFLRDELMKFDHPLKQFTKQLEYDTIFSQIEEKAQNLRQNFDNYIGQIVKECKLDVYNIYTEAQLMKKLHVIIQSWQEFDIQQSQETLSQNIPKLLDTNQLQSLTQQVLKIAELPFRCLDEIDRKLQNLIGTELIYAPSNIKNRPTVNDLSTQALKIVPRRYKNFNRNEYDIVKYISTEKNITDIEIDLLGQMIHRNDVKLYNEIFSSIKLQPKLLELKLTLSSTTISDLSELSKSFSALNDLQKFCISLGNSKVVNVDSFGKSLAYLVALQSLEISLWSTNVAEVSEIGRGIAQIKTLEKLELQLGNTFVSDVFELGKGIGENIKLRDLSLNLEFTRIQDIKELAKGLQKLRYIQEFELDLIDTYVPLKIRKNFFSFNHFLNEWKGINN